MEFTGTTLSELKSFLKENWEKGVCCPGCKQFVKLYKRKLNSGMAYTLLLLYKQPREWIPVKDFLRVNKHHNGHDWTLLNHWKLLEERVTNNNEPNSGRWKITPAGVMFVENKLTVPKHIYFYNSKAWKESKEQTNIIEALGEKFNYKELMS